uniref:Uncharacterized protein n=1 Tax=Anguilla anguilla TaxID=7936 RepID=A0A0E9T3L0_ANGAN
MQSLFNKTVQTGFKMEEQEAARGEGNRTAQTRLSYWILSQPSSFFAVLLAWVSVLGCSQTLQS